MRVTYKTINKTHNTRATNVIMVIFYLRLLKHSISRHNKKREIDHD